VPLSLINSFRQLGGKLVDAGVHVTAVFNRKREKGVSKFVDCISVFLCFAFRCVLCCGPNLRSGAFLKVRLCRWGDGFLKISKDFLKIFLKIF